jgi:gas vesicle protein
MKEKHDDFGSFVAGVTIGGLVGAAVALLLAPQSGEETQRIIKDKSIEIKDRAEEYGTDARLRAEKAFEDARLKADQALSDLRTRTDELATIIKERAAEVQQSLKTPVQKPVEEVVVVEDTSEEDAE